MGCDRNCSGWSAAAENDGLRIKRDVMLRCEESGRIGLDLRLGSLSHSLLRSFLVVNVQCKDWQTLQRNWYTIQPSSRAVPVGKVPPFSIQTILSAQNPTL